MRIITRMYIYVCNVCVDNKEPEGQSLLRVSSPFPLSLYLCKCVVTKLSFVIALSILT